MSKETTQLRQFNDLADIRKYKDDVQTAIHKDEERIADLWHNLFAPSDEARPNTPAKRVAHMLSMGTGIVDGVLLGWKLYRKYKGATTFFSKRGRRH